jgi:hypothetical protein
MLGILLQMLGAQNYDLWKITCFDGSNIVYIRLYLTF